MHAFSKTKNKKTKNKKTKIKRQKNKNKKQTHPLFLCETPAPPSINILIK